MKTSHLSKLACVTAMVLASSVAFAGEASTRDQLFATQSYDPNPSMKASDQDAMNIGKIAKQDAAVVDDATITSNVKKALERDPMLQNTDIKSEVSKGVVTLTGSVGDVRWKARAEEVASSVQGVKEVKNHISIGDGNKS